MAAIPDPATKEIIKPQPGGQFAFLSAGEFEIMYGGSAGPGKTWALVIDALGLQYRFSKIAKAAIEIPEYRAVLFRRKSKNLADMIEEAKSYYYEFGAEYVSHRTGDPGPSFNFPSGARIFTCHLNQERDKEDHQGFEYQYVGFDELPQFLFPQYIYLFSRCRSTITGLIPRIRSTANPVGIGLKWVRDRFQPHVEQCERRFFIADYDDDKNYRGIEVEKDHPDALSRKFIPGFLHENKILMEKDPGYRARIKMMGKTLSCALLESDWFAMEGNFFDSWNPRVHVIKKANYISWNLIRQNYRLLGGLDYGNVTVLHVLAKDNNGNVQLVDEIKMEKETRSRKIAMIKKFLKERGLERMNIEADTNMWIPDAFDKQNQLSPAMEFIRAGIRIQKVSKTSVSHSGYRIACNDAVKDALWYDVNSHGVITKQPKLKVWERCRYFLDTFPFLEGDEDNIEDIADGQEDHGYDSFKYGYMALRTPPKYNDKAEPKWLRDLKAVKQTKKNFYAK